MANHLVVHRITCLDAVNDLSLLVIAHSRNHSNILFSSHDHEFINTVANRIIELTPSGTIDKLMSYDEYIYDEAIKEQKAKMYGF